MTSNRTWVDDLSPDLQRAWKLIEDHANQRARMSQDAPRRLTDAEKLDRCRQFDQSRMPAWRDPRGQ
jgi:hypothetical protein